MNNENLYEFLGGAPEESSSSTIGIFVYVETENNEITEESFVAVGKARELADMLGTGIGAILLNTVDEELGQKLFHAGANKIFQSKDNRFQNFDTELYCEKVGELLKEHNPEIFLSPLSLKTTDFIPRVAQRLQTGLISGGVALEIDTMERLLLATRPIYAGKMHEVHAIETARPQMVLLMPATFPMPIMDEFRQGEIEKV